MFYTFLVVIAWAVFLNFIFHVLFDGYLVHDFFTTLIIVIFVSAVLGSWYYYALKRIQQRARDAAIRERITASQARKPAAPPTPAAVASSVPTSADSSGTITFRVAGTTFDNEDGDSRQEILRHLKYGDAPWADPIYPEELNAELELTSFEGEPAIAVLVNDYQVGFVPKKMVRKVSVAMENHVATFSVSSVRILGGGTSSTGEKLSYGCEITVDY